MIFSRRDSVERLLADLRATPGKGVGVAVAVMRKLAQTGDVRVVEPLVRELGSRAGVCRLAAAEALAQLGDPGWMVAVKGDDQDLSRMARLEDPRVMVVIRRYFGWDDDESKSVAAVGRTLVQHALAHKESAAALRVLRAEQDLDFTDDNGNTAINTACIIGAAEVVAALIARRVDLDLANRFGQTPLRNALAGGFKTIARCLIEAGCRVDTADLRGMTPLFIACRLADVELVELLLAHGAPMGLAHLELQQGPWTDKIVDSAAVIDRLVKAGVDALVPMASWLSVNEGRPFRLDFLQQAIEERDISPDDGQSVIAESTLDASMPPVAHFCGLKPYCHLQDETVSVDVGRAGVVRRYTLSLLTPRAHDHSPRD